jgi:hypothetical protein
MSKRLGWRDAFVAIVAAWRRHVATERDILTERPMEMVRPLAKDWNAGVEREVDNQDAGSRKRKGSRNGGLQEPPGAGESPIAQAGNEAGARFARIPLRAVTEPGLTLTDLRVLIVIAWHANKERLAWPSLTTIATLARTTEHKVTVSTKELETKQLLRKHRRRAEHRWANVYEILLGDPEPPPKSDSAKSDSASLDGEPPLNSDSRTEDSEQKESPTSRAGARERGSFSNDLDGYQPSAETVAWASQKYGLDASDLERINAFQDHWRAKGEIPRNLDAAYHKWIRKEHEFAQRD